MTLATSRQINPGKAAGNGKPKGGNVSLRQVNIDLMHSLGTSNHSSVDDWKLELVRPT